MALFAQLYAAGTAFTFAALLLDTVLAPRKLQDGRFVVSGPTLPDTLAALGVALALAAVWPISLARLGWVVIRGHKAAEDLPMEFKRGPGVRL